MPALTISQIVRKTLSASEVSDGDLTATYIPTAGAIFEQITHEDITIGSDTTGSVHLDMAVAYLTIWVYYSVAKEGYMVGKGGEDSIPAHVWWEQTAYRYLASIGYAEYFEYTQGLYYVKAKQPKAADMMAVKIMTGDEDVI